MSRTTLFDENDDEKALTDINAKKRAIKKRLEEAAKKPPAPIPTQSELDKQWIKEKSSRLAEAMKQSATMEFEKQLSLFDQQGVQLPKTTKLLAPMSYQLVKGTFFLPIKLSGNNATERVIHNKQTLYKDSKTEIQYTGQVLDMVDHGVYLEALRRAASVTPYDDEGDTIPEHSKVIINRANFLKSLGHSAGGKGYALLEASFERLFTATLFIESEDFKHYYRLLSALTYDKRRELYYYAIPRSSFILFFNNKFGYIDMEKRKTLSTLKDASGKRKKYLALTLWMQHFISVHRRGELHWLSLAKLQESAGQKGRLRDFRKSMNHVLDNLKEVGVITLGKIDEKDVVYWK